MSVTIATMGKFWRTGGTVQKVVSADGSSSGYGWEKPKPKIIVSGVRDDEDDFKIRITKVTEWS